MKSDDEPKRLIATEPPLSCSGVLISERDEQVIIERRDAAEQ